MKIIRDSANNNSQKEFHFNSTNNKIIESFDNQSFIVFHFGSHYENRLSTSPQLQYQKQSKKVDIESNSLPIPWIAAIIINAILVFLFIVFVIYCFWKNKKRRQRTRNPEKDSLFSSKSSKHSVQEVTKTETKENIFNIESEHKKLTQNDSFETPIERDRKTSIKTPVNAIRTVTRLGMRSSAHESSIDSNNYNPMDSPSVSKFTNNLNDSVPNQPEYRAKHEEENGEIAEQQNVQEHFRELEQLDEIEDEIYEENGDSGYVDIRQKEPNYDINKEVMNDSKEPKVSKSPIKEKPLSPSIARTTQIAGKVKTLAHSQQKHYEEKRPINSPNSSHSSHSTAVQTSPNRSWADIPGAVPGVVDNQYFDERMINLRTDSERKYFLYIIKDINPFTKRECIGRITLPARNRMTLEQLRYHLMQSEDETIRNYAKKKFKFLSESYRLVVMNESYTPVDQVYQTQGIFIKFSAGDSLPFGYKSKNKYRTKSNNKEENESNFGDRLKPLDSVIRNTKNMSKKPESIYGSTSKSTQRKDSIYGSYGSYGSSYGTTPKTYRKTGVYDSTSKSSEISRFGFQNPSNKRIEANYGLSRTPRRRDQNEFMTTSPQYMSTPMSISPAVSPRTRIRLCQKMNMKRQIEKGQLEKMPSFITSSIDTVCDNPGCINKPLLKCLVCTQVNYCSTNCKKQHWISDHRFICKRPPWKG